MKRVFKIDGDRAKFYAVNAAKSCPTDGSMQIVIEPFKKPRTGGQNRYLWSALMNDFEVQGFFDGRQFNKKIWHHHLKILNLPEPGDEGYSEDVGPKYTKWVELPNGEMMLNGSTTELTVTGFGKYMEKCYALGSEMGIRFSAR
jgi:hypothetical protein